LHCFRSHRAEATTPNSDDKASVANADAAAAAASTIPSNVANAVVEVFSTMRHPDPYRPWTKQAPTEATASGVVIEGKRILTNAHAVLYASQMQVQPNQSGDKIAATIVAVAPGIDLAARSSTTMRFSPRMRRSRARPRCRRSRTRYSPTGFPLAALRSPSRRASCRGSSSCLTTFPLLGCACRSTLQSTLATAAAPRSRAIR
jgi:hypothetical protein